MALNTSKCNHLTPLYFKVLSPRQTVMKLVQKTAPETGVDLSPCVMQIHSLWYFVVIVGVVRSTGRIKTGAKACFLDCVLIMALTTRFVFIICVLSVGKNIHVAGYTMICICNACRNNHQCLKPSLKIPRYFCRYSAHHYHCGFTHLLFANAARIYNPAT